jgi:hypothetical protein
MRIDKPDCSICNKEMKFEEGDIIFGEKWYHTNCAKRAELVIPNP